MKMCNVFEAKRVGKITVYTVRCSKCHNFFKTKKYGVGAICPLCRNKVLVGEYVD